MQCRVHTNLTYPSVGSPWLLATTKIKNITTGSLESIYHCNGAGFMFTSRKCERELTNCSKQAYTIDECPQIKLKLQGLIHAQN